MTAILNETWSACSDGTLRLSNSQGRPIAIIWRDGARWRVSAADDTGPGEMHQTLGEAVPAAQAIFRDRLTLLCDCPPGRLAASPSPIPMGVASPAAAPSAPRRPMPETVFRRHHHPQPLRKTDRRWLERIAAGGIRVGDVPAPIAERLIGKNAIRLVKAQPGERATWDATDRGRAKLKEAP